MLERVDPRPYSRVYTSIWMNISMPTLSIGKLAKSCSVKVDTVRYYGKVGLLKPLTRTQSGYRVYSIDSVERLRFIRKAQKLGFLLDEIRELLSLSDDQEADCGDIRDRARLKIDEIDKKIDDLTRMKKGLAELSDYCPGNGVPLSECGIIQHFYREDA